MYPLQLIAACTVSALLAVAVVGKAPADGDGWYPHTYLMHAPRGAVHVDELMGAVVRSRLTGEKVGAVRDLLFDGDERIVGLVVGVGGILGIGERQVAISWSAVELEREREAGYVLLVNADPQTMSRAPAYARE